MEKDIWTKTLREKLKEKLCLELVLGALGEEIVSDDVVNVNSRVKNDLPAGEIAREEYLGFHLQRERTNGRQYEAGDMP